MGGYTNTSRDHSRSGGFTSFVGGHEDDVKRCLLFGRLCCKTRMFFAVEGLSVSFCHNPLFRSGIEPLRHRHLTHDLRRTSVWRQWRWTAKELGEAAQVLRGGGEQYLVPGAA